MHYIKAKSILSARNGLNLYRGCTHGCIYCDSRSKVYNMDHLFEDVAVKENGLELLEEALKKKRKKCMIGLGSMTDPYIPLEKQICYTRKFLELIDKYNFGATLITKSDLILRDLDLIKKINNKTKCLIMMTLTTYDDRLCKIIEPNVCPTSRRFEVLNILKENNISTVVWITPILPFINDSLDNLKGLMDYIIKAKVKGVVCFGFGVTLREGNREYYYQKLDEYFPGLKTKYINKYHNDYELLSDNNYELFEYFKKSCIENDILYKPDDVFRYMDEFEDKVSDEQMSLF